VVVEAQGIGKQAIKARQLRRWPEIVPATHRMSPRRRPAGGDRLAHSHSCAWRSPSSPSPRSRRVPSAWRPLAFLAAFPRRLGVCCFGDGSPLRLSVRMAERHVQGSEARAAHVMGGAPRFELSCHATWLGPGQRAFAATRAVTPVDPISVPVGTFAMPHSLCRIVGSLTPVKP
jgi:hypothetical protein